MSDHSVEALTKVFVQLRDERSELKKKYEEQDGAIKAKMEKIEIFLMQKLQGFGVDSVKTPFGTVFTAVETRFTCGDWTSYWAWMRDNDRLDGVEKRVSQGAIRTLLEDNIELPPGIETHSERVVRIRRG